MKTYDILLWKKNENKFCAQDYKLQKLKKNIIKWTNPLY